MSCLPCTEPCLKDVLEFLIQLGNALAIQAEQLQRLQSSVDSALSDLEELRTFVEEGEPEPLDDLYAEVEGCDEEEMSK